MTSSPRPRPSCSTPDTASHPLRIVDGVYRGSEFDPWAEVDRLSDEVDVERVCLPAKCGPAAYWSPGDVKPTILVSADPEIRPEDMVAAVTEELLHHRNRGTVKTAGMPEGWRVVRLRDEKRVHDEVVRLLVPFEVLARVIASIVDDGRGVEAWEIAEAFRVSRAVALRALEMLAAEQADCA